MIFDKIRQFRETFRRIFFPRILTKWTAVPLTNAAAPNNNASVAASRSIQAPVTTRANNQIINETSLLNPDPVIV